MDWTRLLSAERLGDKAYQPNPNRSIFVQDHDRIVFSAPFRRLANKTQVQPLYENDHVHHRLIHSIEVSSVGRSLAMRIGQWLAEQKAIEPTRMHDLADIIQAACVAHDIGNPPFGHSGEDAMGSWFAEYFAQGRGPLAQLPEHLQLQFNAFEGNAQGFRILTRLEMYRGEGGMRLTKATLGAFTKYPVTAADRVGLPKDYIGVKKFGIFNSDLPSFTEVAQGVGLLEQDRHWSRHPLVFLMEAADDITYNIVDLEDAFTTGELTHDAVHEILIKLGRPPSMTPLDMTQAEDIARLRARTIGYAIDACVDAFIANYHAIMDGTFSGDLVGASGLGAGFAEIRALAKERIFTASRKTELEVSGRRIIANVLGGIVPVYEEVAAKGWQSDTLSNRSRQLVRALSLDLRDVKDAESALHAMADFTSGMTDRYALRISRMLSGT
jgi:dGTPase